MKTYGDLILYNLDKSREFKINGSLIDAIDYFITIFELNKHIELVLVNGSESHKMKLQSFMKNRYNIENIEELFKNIRVLSFIDLRVSKIRKILMLDYSTVNRMRDTCPVVCNNVNIIVENSSEGNFHNAKYFTEINYFKISDNDIPYTMKMRYDLIKKPKFSKNKVYVNHPTNSSWKKNTDLYNAEHKEAIDYMNKRYKDWFFKTPKPVPNIFEEFDTYIYYQSYDWFDTHPRLFIECSYFDKKIIYINNRNVKDGSWYRYNDLIENGIEHRLLTHDDEIVQIMI